MVTPNTANPPSAKSHKVKEVKAGKKEKKARPKHPLIGAAKGYPFLDLPTDYVVETHAKLKRKDFAESNNFAGYYDYQAMLHTAAAERCKAEAVTARTGGSSSAKEQKRLEKQYKSLLALQAILVKKGVNVDAIVTRAKKAAAEEAAAPQV